MTNYQEDKKKQVIGLYGKMQLAMILHERGWHVHRSYIDEEIDFVITKYWCSSCNKFSSQYTKDTHLGGGVKKCVTNLCKSCKKASLEVLPRYLQVKTSEGKRKKNDNERDFSFHPKLRYNVGKAMFYVWIAVFEKEFLQQNDGLINHPTIHFYIFNTNDLSLFDDISIPTYQITDNQKTTLAINKEGQILNRGRKYSYDCFKKFHNNFDCLEENII